MVFSIIQQRSFEARGADSIKIAKTIGASAMNVIRASGRGKFRENHAFILAFYLSVNVVDRSSLRLSDPVLILGSSPHVDSRVTDRCV
jgi:hypothetical protein